MVSFRNAMLLGIALGLAWPTLGSAQTAAPVAAPTSTGAPATLAPETESSAAALPANPAAAEPTMQPSSGDPLWIWTPTQAQGPIPQGSVYFRKWFSSSAPDVAVLQITADNQYEVYVNGRFAGNGKDWHRMQAINLLPFLLEGKNLIAVKATNNEGTSAGLTARIFMQKKGGPAIAYVTDETWVTSAVEGPLWEKDRFDDSKWLKAHSFGELGVARPWLDQITAEDGSSARRFAVVKDFRIERVVAPNDSGSLLSVTFNEFGEMIAGRERGPILLITDSNKDGVPDKVAEYCDKVKSCQGLLALNGGIYAVGDGPDGAALYLINDEDRDGKGEKVTTLMKFSGGLGEHGPHGLSLGPDGMIYVMIGNHAQAVGAAVKESPYRDYYEGDLVMPRYEDPGGHAVGVKAPGGTVVRLDAEGKSIQTFSGGFRNAYDLAFNRVGELFTFDSDMEWNEGLPWYRATRLQHIFAGSEHGWRSGWSNWPDYNFDGVPPAATAGRGSPTGLEFYEHDRYPPQYQGALFACDWSQGEIIAFKPRASGSGYTSDGEVFVRGRPLAATDVAVGPDGWLYFVTGGRGTEGGVYRVVYTGQLTPPAKLTGVAAAVRQPQPWSAWARQKVALIQQQNPELWGTQLQAAAANATNRSEDRIRSLDLLELYGPLPDMTYFTKLSRDGDPAVRKKTAYLLGVHAEPIGGGLLVQMLRDPDASVRRQACESLARGMFVPPPETILPLLADADRAVSFTARLALERIPVDRWKDSVLNAKDARTFIVGGLALARVSPDRETMLAVLQRGGVVLQGQLSDPEFLDLLRVFQVALERGQLKGDDVPQLRLQIANEYPAGEIRMNRELIRLLAHLDEPTILPRVVEFLKSDAGVPEKIQAALFVRYISKGWTTEQKLYVLAFYEAARKLQGGYSLRGYFNNVAKDFCANLTAQEKLILLSHGDKQPANALSVLSAMTAIEPELIPVLVDLDRRLPQIAAEEARTLQTGIVAILGEAKEPRGMAYLREAFEQQPERRAELAMGLAQAADGENYPLLLRSLPVVEGMAAQEVMLQLAKLDRKPETSEPYRQAILLGLRLRENGGDAAVRLLAKWTGQAPPSGAKWNESLATYQTWFATTYPTQPPAELPKSQTVQRYTLDELAAFLSESGGKGDPSRGKLVFEKAACVKCHRFGGRGESIGPDLSSVAMRFQRREILESILHPSQVISDQYAAKTVTTVDGKVLMGMVAPQGDDAYIVLQPNAQKVTLAKTNIEAITPNKQSAMPEGLLNNLPLQEIADLFAYLNSGGRSVSDFTAESPSQGVNVNLQSRRPNEMRK